MQAQTQAQGPHTSSKSRPALIHRAAASLILAEPDATELTQRLALRPKGAALAGQPTESHLGSLSERLRRGR
jgi:hypothetical protein